MAVGAGEGAYIDVADMAAQKAQRLLFLEHNAGRRNVGTLRSG